MYELRIEFLSHRADGEKSSSVYFVSAMNGVKQVIPLPACLQKVSNHLGHDVHVITRVQLHRCMRYRSNV